MDRPDHLIWKKLLAHVQKRSPNLWRQWFEEIEPVAFDGGVFLLRVRNTVQHRYLQRDCAQAFTDAAQEATDRLVAVRFLAPEADVRELEDDDEAQEKSRNGSAPLIEARPRNASPRIGLPSGGELILNPDYNFENFVIGPGNRFAHAAALAVAENPGLTYNPMFIYGGVGLGKTHLLQAVCARVLDRNPDTQITYISCEDFITQFMDAVQVGQMAGFRHHFRDVDLLVIDDIHFLANRDRTQEEFFHTFNSLHQARRQIILSSDAAPDEIPHLEARLVSRFKWGLVADIQAPDYETRVAIVKQKAKVRGVDLPGEVAELIAERCHANIRELEGALTKIQMHGNLEESPISMALARTALGVETNPHANKATIEVIVNAVTEFYDVTLSNLQSKRRQRSIAQPRQVCMYFARRFTRYSLEEIGGYFGGRDHTTVLHAVRTVQTYVDQDPEFAKRVDQIEATILGNA